VPAAGTAGPSSRRPGGGCELREVSVAYGATPAVGPVSLRVPAGQSVALVGPSGAGKTTLLRVLAGQLAPTTGQVLVAGRDLAELHDRRDRARAVGIMSQRLDLVPQLSVKHNVQAGVLGRWGLARSLAALLLPLEHPPAREAVERVGLADHFGTRVAALSGGQAQRVALARLLVQDPAVLLVDEPAASVDPARADDLLALLHQAARRNGHTVLTSLHDPDLARRHVDRVVGLREGKVLFDLPPDSVTDEMLQSLYRLLSPVEPRSHPQAGSGS
jgi:phosphonate transport system ATP-binding protein